jgi:hypothetical protein
MHHGGTENTERKREKERMIRHAFFRSVFSVPPW